MNRYETDLRYAYIKCPKCGKLWQRIDYGCAMHIVSCVPTPNYGPLPEPVPWYETVGDSGLVLCHDVTGHTGQGRTCEEALHDARNDMPYGT